MTTTHICRQRPGFSTADDPWAEGAASQCAFHSKWSTMKQVRVKGIQEKRARDKAAGVVGTQRTGYISGQE